MARVRVISLSRARATIASGKASITLRLPECGLTASHMARRTCTALGSRYQYVAVFSIAALAR